MALTLIICFGMLTVAILLSLYRMKIGPTVLDRVLAFDMIALATVGKIVLLSVLWDSVFFVEVVLIFSLLGFVGTVAFSLYLYRTSQPEELEPAAQEAAVRAEEEGL